MPNTNIRNLDGLNVLVVEDEALVRYFIVFYLQELGCIVREVETGEAAISLLEKEASVDVVFTDIRLGGLLNGWDVAEAFRAARPSIPIIYTSGFAASSARPVPGSLFIQKPYHPAQILNACAQLSLPTRH